MRYFSFVLDVAYCLKFCLLVLPAFHSDVMTCLLCCHRQSQPLHRPAALHRSPLWYFETTTAVFVFLPAHCALGFAVHTACLHSFHNHYFRIEFVALRWGHRLFCRPVLTYRLLSHYKILLAYFNLPTV